MAVCTRRTAGLPDPLAPGEERAPAARASEHVERAAQRLPRGRRRGRRRRRRSEHPGRAGVGRQQWRRRRPPAERQRSARRCGRREPHVHRHRAHRHRRAEHHCRRELRRRGRRAGRSDRRKWRRRRRALLVGAARHREHQHRRLYRSLYELKFSVHTHSPSKLISNHRSLSVRGSFA